MKTAFKPANRRRAEQIHRGDASTTEFIDYTPDEFEFLKAMDGFITSTGIRFPTLRDTLGVLRSLGYVKMVNFPGISLPPVPDRVSAGSVSGRRGGAESRTGR